MNTRTRGTKRQLRSDSTSDPASVPVASSFAGDISLFSTMKICTDEKLVRGNYAIPVLHFNEGTPKVPGSSTHTHRGPSHTRHHLDLHTPFGLVS